MTETITTLDVRNKLGDLLNRVALRHDQFIVERKGKPLAAMVPVEKLAKMEEGARMYLSGLLARNRGTNSVGGADALADEAKHRTRGALRKSGKSR